MGYILVMTYFPRKIVTIFVALQKDSDAARNPKR